MKEIYQKPIIFFILQQKVKIFIQALFKLFFLLCFMPLCVFRKQTNIQSIFGVFSIFLGIVSNKYSKSTENTGSS